MNTLISFILPSRNNLKYLKCAYNSIRNNILEKHEIVMLDDFSNDGTWDWLSKIKKEDENVIIYRHDGPTRIGHCVLYDKGVELSTNEIFTIFHADMIASPNYVNNLVKNLKQKTVVSSTRIEPPLHPASQEKYIKFFGMEPEEFQHDKFLKFVNEKELENKNKITNGIFAPWCMYKSDFLEIGGHDKKLFAPMELEDSDLFNRFYLNKYNLIQSWDSLVWHFTCRGSRFKDGVDVEKIIDLPDGSKWYKPKDSEEYISLRKQKFREWWRKWKTNVLHDNMMLPIVGNVYDIGLVITDIKNYNENQFLNIIYHIEPWVSKLGIFDNYEHPIIKKYIEFEQPNTKYNLHHRIVPENVVSNNDITLYISYENLLKNINENITFITMLSDIISDSGKVGNMSYNDFKIKIKSLNTYQHYFIKNN